MSTAKGESTGQTERIGDRKENRKGPIDVKRRLKEIFRNR